VLDAGVHAGKIQIELDDGRMYHVFPWHLQEAPPKDEEAEAKSHLERLKLDLKDNVKEEGKSKMICSQITQVQDILNQLGEERLRKAAEEKQRNEEEERRRQEEEEVAERACFEEDEAEEKQLEEADRLARGTELNFSLFNAEDVSKCLNRNVTSIACARKATIMLYEHGGWSWTSGLTKNLHNKLNGHQQFLPSPVFVAMGLQDWYYIQFQDGMAQYVGCDDLTSAIEGESVKTVAFGEAWDSYFVVFANGSWSYQNIPTGLQDVLKKRNYRKDLVCVALGPAGEYFLKARNGRAWWGGLTEENLDMARQHGDRIQFMDFGDDDAFLYRYT
jgi:hypothetical protein